MCCIILVSRKYKPLCFSKAVKRAGYLFMINVCRAQKPPQRSLNLFMAVELHIVSVFESLIQRDLVGIFEDTAYGESESESRHLDTERL